MRVKVPITTDGSGNATVYTGNVAGTLDAIYVDIGTLAAGAVDLVITEETTGAPIVSLTNLAASGRYLIRNQASDAAGAAIAGAYDSVPVAGRIKTVVAQGGAAKTGNVYFYVSGVASAADHASAPRTLTQPPGPI